MEGLSRWVVQHRMVVGLLWLAITVVGVVVAPSVSGHLESGVHVDSAAFAANHDYGQNPSFYQQQIVARVALP